MEHYNWHTLHPTLALNFMISDIMEYYKQLGFIPVHPGWSRHMQIYSFLDNKLNILEYIVKGEGYF